MDISALPPLVAVVAYIPLLAVLISNRPWQRQHRLFAWFLIAAILWGISGILWRSGFFMADKLLLSRIVFCAFTLMAVQFHCFISSFYPQGKGRWIPLAYASIAITIALAALGYIPEAVVTIDGTVYTKYGKGILLMGLPLAILTVRNIYFLRQRFTTSDDPVLRNQTVYLLLSVCILTSFVFTTFLPWANKMPISHFGNLAK